MDEDSDFTFCQVAKPIDEVDKRLVSDLGDMKINGERLNDSIDGQTGGFLSMDKSDIKPISPRQETIGSLSFKVTDRSGPGKASNLLTPGDGTSSKISQELKAGGKKPTSRAKVPFEKGYSQMDWLKLTQTHPDLAGLKGQSNKRLISMAEVKEHQTEGSMWTVLKGRVYNIYPYMKFHPGGVDLLMKAVGKDCTSLFNKYHAWVNAEFLLEKCLVGILDESR